MNSIRFLAFALFSTFMLAACGNDSGRRTAPVQPLAGRGRTVEKLVVDGAFSETASIEHLDFGGAVLTKLIVPLNITITDDVDKDVVEELFWESAREATILTPNPKKCVPSLFGIQKNEGRFELRFWAWDNVGVTTDCEDLIYAMKEKGIRLQLKNVKWAEVGLVKSFEATLRPLP